MLIRWLRSAKSIPSGSCCRTSQAAKIRVEPKASRQISSQERNGAGLCKCIPKRPKPVRHVLKLVRRRRITAIEIADPRILQRFTGTEPGTIGRKAAAQRPHPPADMLTDDHGANPALANLPTHIVSH